MKRKLIGAHVPEDFHDRWQKFCRARKEAGKNDIRPPRTTEMFVEALAGYMDKWENPQGKE